ADRPTNEPEPVFDEPTSRLTWLLAKAGEGGRSPGTFLGSDVDVFASVGVVEVDDSRNVQRDVFIVGWFVARRRFWFYDVEDGEHPQKLPDRHIEHHDHLHHTAAKIVVT